MENEKQNQTEVKPVEQKDAEKTAEKGQWWKDSRAEFVQKLIKDAKAKKSFWWDCGYERPVPALPKSLRIEEINRKREIKAAKAGVKPKLADSYYHGVNIVRLMEQAAEMGYKDSRWATYKQIIEMGGHVKKGEKGTVIEHWSEEKKVKYQWNEETKRSEPIMKQNEDGTLEPETYWKPHIGKIVVFNVAQTEGLPLDIAKPRERVVSEEEKTLAMEQMIKNSEAEITHHDITKNYYQPGDDTIHVLRPERFDSMEEYYATVAHEIGHSTGHPSRFNRDLTNRFGTAGYAREELIAEMTATFITAEYGICGKRMMKNHEAYLMNWDRKLNYIENNPEKFFEIVSEADKAAKYIREHMIEKGLTVEQVAELRGYTVGAREAIREEDEAKYKEEYKAKQKEKTAVKKVSKAKTVQKKPKINFQISRPKNNDRGMSH